LNKNIRIQNLVNTLRTHPPRSKRSILQCSRVILQLTNTPEKRPVFAVPPQPRLALPWCQRQTKRLI
jgi:hypothetical protein